MAPADELQSIARLPLFAALEPEAVRLLCLAADVSALYTGEVVFRRGDRSDGGCFVVSGLIGLFSNDEDKYPAATVHPGSMMGELALIIGTERPMTAKALEPSRIAKISRGAFKRVLQERPASGAALRTALAGRLAGFLTELRSMDD